MSEIVMYATATCPFCLAAKNFLVSNGMTYREIRVDIDQSGRSEMRKRSGRTSVPQIFIGETHVGGYDDMIALHRVDGLKPLLEQAK